MADPLSDVLGSVRLNGAVWFVVECGGTWATAAPPASAVAARIMPGAGHVIEFHAVTRGRCVGGIVEQRGCCARSRGRNLLDHPDPLTPTHDE